MHQGLEDVPALLSGGGDDGTHSGEVVGTPLGAEATGDLLAQLGHLELKRLGDLTFISRGDEIDVIEVLGGAAIIRYQNSSWEEQVKRIAFKVLLVQPPVPWFKTIQGCAADCAPGSGASSSLARRRPAVPRLRRSAPLLALFGLLAAIGTRRSRVRKSIARQVGISRCRFDIGVPEQLANHRQGLAERQRAGSEAVSEISFADARNARCRGTSAADRRMKVELVRRVVRQRGLPRRSFRCRGCGKRAPVARILLPSVSGQGVIVPSARGIVRLAAEFAARR